MWGLGRRDLSPGTRTLPRTLITGGAGFLGSHLCDRLIEEGHEVVCLDNLITGRMDNVAHLMGHERFRFIKQDVTEYLYIEGSLDYVLHFASPASPVDYQRLPIQTLKVGSLGTHKALGLAKAKGARFLLASTSEVYGDPVIHPQREEYWGNVNPVGPRGVYDEAKRFAEAMAMAYHRYHGLDTRIARIFNTYGPRMRPNDGRVVSNFVNQALRGESLTIYGDGRQTRSFCYVSDLIEGLYCLLMSNEVNPVNIGNPKEFTVLELAHMVLEAVGSSSAGWIGGTTGSSTELATGIEFRPLPLDDPRVRQPDIGLAMATLGWEPKVQIAEGLALTIEYFRKQLTGSC